MMKFFPKKFRKKTDDTDAESIQQVKAQLVKYDHMLLKQSCSFKFNLLILLDAIILGLVVFCAYIYLLVPDETLYSYDYFSKYSEVLTINDDNELANEAARKKYSDKN